LDFFLADFFLVLAAAGLTGCFLPELDLLDDLKIESQPSAYFTVEPTCVTVICVSLDKNESPRRADCYSHCL
jgi:hypothetical protein